jgi:UDP-N-acetylmuramoyl-tripeptide--D-alanyl-D-alanine ligase
MNGPLWTATEAAAALGAEFRSDWAATGVSIDSRAVKPGDLFIAIIGDRLDGHVYVKKALEAGAVGAIVHHTPEGLDAGDTRLLIVEDTRWNVWAVRRDAGRMPALSL